VVVARIREVEPAGAAAAEAGTALVAGALACGLGDDPEVQAAATRMSVTSGTIRANSLLLTTTEPGAIAIPPSILAAAHPNRERSCRAERVSFRGRGVMRARRHIDVANSGHSSRHS
jgi:hypothetical protein